MAKIFRKRNKSEVQTEYTCSVRFLDDEPMHFTFKKDTIGQWLVDRVSEKLNLMEKDYFGLRYIDTEKQRHWLDPLKTVYKQMKGITPMVLCFRVKFYPEEPVKLREEITRYYLFLQLRRDLHHGRLLCSPDDAVYLAAYIVQSEVGDYDPEDHPPGYISEFKMLPKQTPKLEERVMEQHRALRGQVPSEAEGNFLKRACTLDTYGVDPHQVKDQKGDQLYLGITYQGIMTFRGSRRTQLYKWSQIRRISYEGKMFIVHVNVNEEGDFGPSKKKQQPVSYKCQTAPAAKYLWRSAVEQQLFFTLATASTAPKLRSGGSLFSRGSKFRFSGRCQNEAYEASQRIHRQEPNFPRSSSLPNFAKRHGSNSSRSSAILVTNRDSSLLDDSHSDDRRRYNVIWASGKKPEAAVDVPHSLAMLNSSTPYQPQVRMESKSIRAPLAPQENYFEDQQQQQQQRQQGMADQTPPHERTSADVEVITASSAVTAATTPPSRMWQQNGQVVRDAEDILREEAERGGDASFRSSYSPDSTFYSEEGEEAVERMQQQRLRRFPVQEELMQQASVAPASASAAMGNHVPRGLTSLADPTPITLTTPTTSSTLNQPAAAYATTTITTTPTAATTTPAAAPPVAASRKKKRSGGGGGGCGACVAGVVVSVLMALVLMAVLFYALYFSGWQHPLLAEARSHLTFLEPARDLVAKHGQELVSFFGK